MVEKPLTLRLPCWRWPRLSAGLDELPPLCRKPWQCWGLGVHLITLYRGSSGNEIWSLQRPILSKSSTWSYSTRSPVLPGSFTSRAHSLKPGTYPWGRQDLNLWTVNRFYLNYQLWSIGNDCLQHCTEKDSLASSGWYSKYLSTHLSAQTRAIVLELLYQPLCTTSTPNPNTTGLFQAPAGLDANSSVAE